MSCEEVKLLIFFCFLLPCSKKISKKMNIMYKPAALKEIASGSLCDVLKEESHLENIRQYLPTQIFYDLLQNFHFYRFQRINRLCVTTNELLEKELPLLWINELKKFSTVEEIINTFNGDGSQLTLHPMEKAYLDRQCEKFLNLPSIKPMLEKKKVMISSEYFRFDTHLGDLICNYCFSHLCKEFPHWPAKQVGFKRMNTLNKILEKIYTSRTYFCTVCEMTPLFKFKILNENDNRNCYFAIWDAPAVKSTNIIRTAPLHSMGIYK